MVDQLIEQHGKRLYGLCRSLCATPAEADDLYQETWLKVFQKIEQYDPTYKFEGWLTRICVNIYRDAWRRKKISRIFDGYSSQEVKDSVLENAVSPQTADYLDLHEAVQQLPDKLRITILLYYFKDMEISQTAEALSIPVGTVKSRLNKAKQLLKETMKDEIEL